MAQEVYMDIPQVQKMAQTFGSFGDILHGVSQALQAAITILQVTAFIGLVGGTAVEAYLNMIKPRVDQLSNKMHELQGDITGAISNYETGDQSGSARFR